MKEIAWSKYTDKERANLESFCEKYKNFISTCKTERECVKESIKIAEKAGFINLNDAIKNNQKLKAGDKVYAINMDKAMMLVVIGEEEMENGLKIVGSHIDSPRLDIKATPLYENNNICMLDTHYYGGIKKYHWVARPLALHGVIVKKNGSKINVVIGEKEDDPVVYISDLLPHLKDGNKPEPIDGESLNIIAGFLSRAIISTLFKSRIKLSNLEPATI